MPQTVDSSRIDPVDAARNGMPNGGDGIPIILIAPPDGPVAADRPGSKPDPGDVHVCQAKLSTREGVILRHHVPLDIPSVFQLWISPDVTATAIFPRRWHHGLASSV